MNLETKIKLDEAAINSPNLATALSEGDLVTIGTAVFEQYQQDKASRSQWERRNEAAIELATQVQKTKTYPWQGASNVVFPLVTVACLQFNARAYPSIVNGRNVVKCRVLGGDPTGKLYEKAQKVGQYMSWQLLEQDDCWESEMDMALFLIAISGGGWKKTYFNPQKGFTVSELILPKDFVINYWAKDSNEAPRTHIIPLTKNDIHDRVRRGVFVDVLEEDWFKGDASPERTTQDVKADNRQGQNPPPSNDLTPFICLEQHTFLDLDGDGYAEPVIVTIHEETSTVLRIVYRIDTDAQIEKNKAGELIRIQATEYFTKIPFVPSPDGGVYDIGFGTLLGPLNESVNSAINQLIDASTLSNTAGGFLGRGAKIRGGVYEFNPFGWNRVDSTGDDLKKSIFPLPVREPSNVLFQLLSLLIEYTNRVSGATDMLTGVNPGQNTPAETSRSMVEQGQKIYSAIFKRIWRSLKSEFRKLYRLNGIHLPEVISFGGSPNFLTRNDFLEDPTAIVPAADPAITSDASKLTQAQVLRQAAQSNPGYNPDAVEIRFLEALQVDGISQLYKGIANVPPMPNPKMEIQQIKTQVEMARLEFEKSKFIANLWEMRKLNEAKIVQLYAQADMFLKQGGGAQSQQQIAEFDSMIQGLKVHNDSINQIIQQFSQAGAASGQPSQSNQQPNGGASPVPGMAQPSGNEPASPMGAESPPGTNGPMG